jgi:hypothetical protein
MPDFSRDGFVTGLPSPLLHVGVELVGRDGGERAVVAPNAAEVAELRLVDADRSSRTGAGNHCNGPGDPVPERRRFRGDGGGVSGQPFTGGTPEPGSFEVSAARRARDPVERIRADPPEA